MKTIKTLAVFVTLLLASVVVSFAKSPEKTEEVTKNLVRSLEHDVDGVVEASIYNSLFLQKYYPEANMKKVINKLNEVAENSSNPSIQYKAQLASLYLSNYSSNDLSLDEYKGESEKLFQKISDELTTKLLVSND